jgi:cobalamin biosynthesis protein CobD/CbiB
MFMTQLAACRDWLLAPVGRVTEIKRRLIFRALRSRFFFIVASLTAIPTFLQAAGATWKATHGNPEAGPVLLWIAAIAAWVLFALTVLSEHWSLQRRSERKQSMRFFRREVNEAARRRNGQSDAEQ